MTALLPALPIDAVLPDLDQALDKGPAAVLVAPPGAGKTTRVPLALLEAGWRADGTIIVVEPRRLAARAAARRMAQTLGENVGETVGYRVRLDTKVSSCTRIEVVTDGVFVRRILADPELTGVAAVLFDEVHERSLSTDLGLALALDATALRPELRLVAMSATLDGERFASLFGGAPVIESAGRAFPVQTRHIAPTPNVRIEDTVVSAVRNALAVDPGSVLVFLPGQGEIERVATRLRKGVERDVIVAPLYGQLPAREQDIAIQPAPEGKRKVVLATTIAQTSLTIEGVRIVIDTGLSRQPRFEPATGMTRLVTGKISQAAAEQRRGRAGRTEPGVCYRLWHEGQTAAMIPFDPPEMAQADLAPLALDLAAWGVSDPDALSFLDPVPRPAWAEAVALLTALGAIDAAGRITAHGHVLARLPLHPRLGHMIVLAAADHAARQAALVGTIVSDPGLGGRAVDLAERIKAFAADRSPAARAARGQATGWVEALEAPRNQDRTLGVGLHLARAFPDRVAQRTGPGRYRLANGRGALLADGEGPGGAPFLAVAEVTGSAASGRIRCAAPLSREEIETEFAAAITAEESLAFDPKSRAVRARRQMRLRALILEASTVPIGDPDAAAPVLAAGIAALGIASLPWSKAQSALRARVTYLHERVGAPWPDLSDAALAQGDAGWLVPHIRGLSALSDITANHLDAALYDLVPWDRRTEIDALLPTHFAVPSGSRVPIDYAAENGPALNVRVQEVFGLDTHPTIGQGRIPLLLVLLSPAHRPIQTTRDLPGFWRGTWREVAKDLRGRYPRHAWPDDPLTAAATARAKPRT